MNQQQLQNSGVSSGANALPKPYWNAGRRVFALWGLIVLSGFIGTHFDQTDATKVDLIWVVLSVIGLAYMKKQMSFEYKDLRNIFITWLVVIVFGIAMSQAAFTYVSLARLSGYLGAFWLVIMALGHAITGLIDKKKLYIATTGLQLVAALAIYMTPMLILYQYLIAGVVGALAMVMLILYA